MAEPPARWFEIQLLRPVVPSEVVFRALPHETVLLNMKTGRYHGLDALSARFFETVRDAPSVSAACDSLTAEFEQPLARVRGDVLSFLEELETRGLIVLEPAT